MGRCLSNEIFVDGSASHHAAPNARVSAAAIFSPGHPVAAARVPGLKKSSPRADVYAALICGCPKAPLFTAAVGRWWQPINRFQRTGDIEAASSA